MKAQLRHMAQQALDVQTACNLSGVVIAFARIVQELRTLGFDTPGCNKHPVCRLFAEQISHLTGAGCGDMDTYRKAYDECVRLANPDNALGLPCETCGGLPCREGCRAVGRR